MEEDEIIPKTGFDTRLSFARFIQVLFERYGDDIENQKNFRNIIDAFYDNYYNYLRFEVYLTLFGYQIPLFWQMFS